MTTLRCAALVCATASAINSSEHAPIGGYHEPVCYHIHSEVGRKIGDADQIRDNRLALAATLTDRGNNFDYDAILGVIHDLNQREADTSSLLVERPNGNRRKTKWFNTAENYRDANFFKWRG